MTSATPSKPVIGIVGGIGSGKSTAAGAFAALGCATLDADAIGHDLLRQDDVRAALHAQWGDAIFASDGSVRRAALGNIVFHNREALDALQTILHPRIRARLEAQIARARRDAAVPAVVIDAAVLFEAGWDDLCTHTVFVDAPRPERIRRVQQSRGWSPDELAARESAQIPLDKKRESCCYTVDNRSDGSHLQGQISRLFHQILHE